MSFQKDRECNEKDKATRVYDFFASNPEASRTNCLGSSFNKQYSCNYSHPGCQYAIMSNWLSVNSSKSKLPKYLTTTSKAIIYQTIGANTGGTTALNLIYRSLKEIGYVGVNLCDETNRYSDTYAAPSVEAIAITGEWCSEVLNSYISPSKNQKDQIQTEIGRQHENKSQNQKECTSIEPTIMKDSAFLGRGLQYYLGFHHARDSCRGRVAMTDSHYLSSLLGFRSISAYYLGCIMTDRFRKAYLDLIKSAEGGAVRVAKENLIVVDPDFIRHYPPERPMQISAPKGYRVVYAEDVPPSQMPLLLQRAKIVLDLGMPGPERIAGEGMILNVLHRMD